SRLAWRQGPQGSEQHLALAAPATRARAQRPRKYLAVHARELAVEPNFQILRRYRRSLLLRLEHAHRSAVENHVHRPPRLGSRRSLNLRIGITRPRGAGLGEAHVSGLEISPLLGCRAHRAPTGPDRLGRGQFRGLFYTTFRNL